MDSCVFLGANSSYSALEDDQVYLEEDNEVPHSSSSTESINDVPAQDIVADRSTEFIIELQVKYCFISSLSRFFFFFLILFEIHRGLNISCDLVVISFTMNMFVNTS